MNLFRRLGAVLPGSKDQGAVQANDGTGGFGPPGGLVWTTPTDVPADDPDVALADDPAADASLLSEDDELLVRVADDMAAPEPPAPAARASAPPPTPARPVAPQAAPPVPEPEDEHALPDVLTAALREVLASAPPPSAPPEPVAAPAAPVAPAPEPDPPGPAGIWTDISGTADIGGFVGACLVDSESGLMLASEGGDGLDLEAIAALNTQVVKAEHAVIETLGLDDAVQDILVTMRRQLHFIRPLESSPSVFLYVCLDKKGANLGMARMQVNRIESALRL